MFTEKCQWIHTGFQQNKPGMPPNQIGGTGKKRGMKQGNVPPVHSMTNVIKMDVSQMSTAEKIRRFCLFLQSDASKVNAIQTIENGITGSKLGLKTEYKVSHVWLYNLQILVGKDLTSTRTPERLRCTKWNWCQWEFVYILTDTTYI